MRRESPPGFVFCFACFALVPLLTLAPVASAAAGVRQFQAAVDRIIAGHSSSKTEWGVAIRTADGQSLYEKKSLRLLVPASNRKLFTSALALHTMGPRYRFRTALYAAGEISERGHLRGDLVLAGGGDPTFGNPKFENGAITATLEAWADLVAAAGIRFVHRDLVVDCSGFAPSYNSVAQLPDDYIVNYNARPSAFPFYENCIAVRLAPGDGAGRPARVSLYPAEAGLPLNNQATTGAKNSANTLRVSRPPEADLITVEGSIPLGAPSEARLVALHSPPRAAGNILQRYLTQRGVTVRGVVKVAERRPAPPVANIAFRDSPPLAEILTQVNRRSNNLCAEQLYLGVSRRVGGYGSYERSRDIERRFLDQIGINPQYVRPEDGSGLSRANLCTADAIVRLLTWSMQQEWFEDFKNSLAVSGKSGTLRNRLGGKRLLGRVYAKTGTLNRVSCLSGYYFAPDGNCYVFSMLVNDYSSGSAVAAQNKILEALARL